MRYAVASPTSRNAEPPIGGRSAYVRRPYINHISWMLYVCYLHPQRLDRRIHVQFIYFNLELGVMRCTLTNSVYLGL